MSDAFSLSERLLGVYDLHLTVKDPCPLPLNLYASLDFTLKNLNPVQFPTGGHQ